MDLALNNLKSVDMPLNKEIKPIDFEKKYLKKTERQIVRNVINISLKIETIVRIH